MEAFLIVLDHPLVHIHVDVDGGGSSGGGGGSGGGASSSAGGSGSGSLRKCDWGDGIMREMLRRVGYRYDPTSTGQHGHHAYHVRHWNDPTNGPEAECAAAAALFPPIGHFSHVHHHHQAMQGAGGGGGGGGQHCNAPGGLRVAHRTSFLHFHPSHRQYHIRCILDGMGRNLRCECLQLVGVVALLRHAQAATASAATIAQRRHQQQQQQHHRQEHQQPSVPKLEPSFALGMAEAMYSALHHHRYCERIQTLAVCVRVRVCVHVTVGPTVCHLDGSLTTEYFVESWQEIVTTEFIWLVSFLKWKY